MAGWCREVSRERMLFERIVALLVSLAFLAERAASASPRRRREVNLHLVAGEAAARDMIARLGGLPPQPDAADPAVGPSAADDVPGSIEDSLRRAATFWVLALALNGLLEDARRAEAQPSPIFSASMNAACGMSTLPNWRMRFLPSFCFSSSLRLRVTSPP